MFRGDHPALRVPCCGSCCARSPSAWRSSMVQKSFPDVVLDDIVPVTLISRRVKHF